MTLNYNDVSQSVELLIHFVQLTLLKNAKDKILIYVIIKSVNCKSLTQGVTLGIFVGNA